MKCSIRKNVISFISLVLLSALSLSACGNSGGGGSADTVTSKEGDTVIDNKCDYSMQYGEVIDLTGKSLSTSDSGVITVNNGKMTACGTGSATLTADGVDYTVEVAPAVVDVVLFTGQSNMVGRETSKYACDIPEGMAYEYKMNSADKLSEVKNPVGETFGGVEVSSGSSIVPEFCRQYVEQTGRKIVAVHLARGGRAISYFAQGGEIYNDIIQKYGACLDYLKADKNFEIGHKFYIMLQGESDTASTTVTKYKSLYMKFHDGIKTEFGIEFGAIMYTGRNTVEYKDGIVRITRAKLELASEHDDIIIAGKDAMTYYTKQKEYLRSDMVHFNADGLKKIAQDCCKYVVSFMGTGTDTSKKGIDPEIYIPDPNTITGIYFEKAEITAAVGSSKSFSCLYNVSAGIFGTADDIAEPVDNAVTYTSDNPAVATVENGKLNALSAGAAVITAVYNSNTALTARITVTVTTDAPAEDVRTYTWSFNDSANADGNNPTVTKAGNGSPVINGSYSYTDASSITYYKLSGSLILSADSDWSLEWKGKTQQTMSNSASILLSDNGTQFITYQKSNGIYIRCGDNKVFFNSADVLAAMYTENQWKLVYDADTGKLELFLNGASKGTKSWSSNITVSCMLGRSSDCHFVGSLDFMTLTISE